MMVSNEVCTENFTSSAGIIPCTTDQKSFTDRAHVLKLFRCPYCDKNVFTSPFRTEFMELSYSHESHCACLEKRNTSCLECHTSPECLHMQDFCETVVSSDNRVPSNFVGSNKILFDNSFCQDSRESKSTESIGNTGTSQQKYRVMKKTRSPAYSVNEEIDVSSRKDLAFDNKKNDQKIFSSEEQKFVQEIDLETRKNDWPTVDSTTSSLEHLVDLYRKATEAEITANEAIQKKTLCWYRYANGFIDNAKELTPEGGELFKDMVNQLSETNHETVHKKTQEAIKLYDLSKSKGLEENGNIIAYDTNSDANCTDDSAQRNAANFFVELIGELSDKRDTLAIDPTAEDTPLPQELSPSEFHGSTAILSNKESISVGRCRHCENFCDCPGLAHEVKGIPKECSTNSPEYLNCGPLDYAPLSQFDGTKIGGVEKSTTNAYNKIAVLGSNSHRVMNSKREEDMAKGNISCDKNEDSNREDIVLGGLKRPITYANLICAECRTLGSICLNCLVNEYETDFSVDQPLSAKDNEQRHHDRLCFDMDDSDSEIDLFRTGTGYYGQSLFDYYTKPFY
ncbi:unnamed protein product [Rhizophagus irregularis]|uniref:Uncharacterized protein n=2 Tax=Rhizophagus irregularis TaxID=588596 RepID=A0A915ZXY2_9GLOM|nr:unnamed protein product [Rhizophagus irregularis]